MYVEVSRTGGFAGITRTWAVEVDNTPDPMSWIVLVEACPWDEPEPEPSGADRFIFGVRSGADTIGDYSFSDGDRLDLQGQSYSLSVVNTGPTPITLITLSGGGTISLSGVTSPAPGAVI